MINLKNLKSLFVLEGDEEQDNAKNIEKNTIIVEEKEEAIIVTVSDTPPPLPIQKQEPKMKSKGQNTKTRDNEGITKK